jgi:hypothetical protein
MRATMKRMRSMLMGVGIMAALLVAALLVAAPAAYAKAPAGQGRTCNATQRCDGELQCVKHRDGKSTCEQICAAATKCPEDQRCVKDGSELLCRPITDLDL